MPQAAVVYHEIWADQEGWVIRMDEHLSALRRWIIDEHIWCEADWFPVMSGIATRLAEAHGANLVHMDLKPSNSLHPRLKLYILMI